MCFHEVIWASEDILKRLDSVECACVCGHVYVVYEDTNLYNDMGIT